jgi:hypothetical protein
MQISALPLPDRFYLSPLGADERPQKHPDQRSLRFATFNGETVLEVSGNYCAVYLREGTDANERAHQTFEDVLLPILKVMVSPFPTYPAGVQGYVLEVSHRVRGRVLGFPWLTTENVALALSQAAAEQLVAAKNLREQQAALGEVQVYLNAEPITLRLAERRPERPDSHANQVRLGSCLKRHARVASCAGHGRESVFEFPRRSGRSHSNKRS